ncbi:Uncharacterised protein [Edwardsiella tarda]|nr:Uncharacterised protein [Edwardsiella tarda]
MTTIPVNSHWAYILDYSRGSLVLFLGLAIVFGVVTYRLAGQVNSPVAYLREALRRHQFIPTSNRSSVVRMSVWSAVRS